MSARRSRLLQNGRQIMAAVVVLVCLSSATVRGGSVQVELDPQFRSQPFPFAALALTNRLGQTISVTRLDMLLSDIGLRNVEGQWIQNTQWQAFIDVGEKRSSFQVDGLPAGTYDKLRFLVGVRAALNHGDPARYPAGHPLNPNLNGLHWNWANGYVFFALEGNWADGRKISGYSFHLGNDPMLMTVELALPSTLQASGTLTLALDLDEVLDFKIDDETSSTHSREGDQLAIRLKGNVERAFKVMNVVSTPARVTGAPATMAANIKGTPYRFTFSSHFPMPELPRDNPLTEEGVELGRRLFSEKRLSKNDAQSCASCHDASHAFTDSPKPFSKGADGEEGTRNSMPIFNLAWKKSFFWDGRAPTLREQVLEPIQNPVEMHETLTNVVAKLSNPAESDYPALFERAFGSREVTSARVALALEQFLLTQLSYDSKFDRVMKGDGKLTDEERRGFELFITEYDPRREQFGADCFHCHGGPFFTTHGFANNGLDAEFKDSGRAVFTRNEADKGKFAVPSLRNVALTAPYMHDGRFETLEAVVEHYSGGVKRSATLDPNLAKHPDGGVPLSEDDKKALVAFLKTLTEERFLEKTGNKSQLELSNK